MTIDNEAASRDLAAAELIFYSQSARPQTSLVGVCEPVTDGRPIWGWEFALRLPRKTGAAAAAATRVREQDFSVWLVGWQLNFVPQKAV